MKEIKKVILTDRRVKLVVEDRDSYGYLKKRQQMTFRRDEFEAALARAEITVPWNEAR